MSVILYIANTRKHAYSDVYNFAITNLSSMSLSIFCFCLQLSDTLTGVFLLFVDVLVLETGDPKDVEDKHSKNIIIIANIKY